jgi:hypothetical protein
VVLPAGASLSPCWQPTVPRLAPRAQTLGFGLTSIPSVAVVATVCSSDCSPLPQIRPTDSVSKGELFSLDVFLTNHPSFAASPIVSNYKGHWPMVPVFKALEQDPRVKALATLRNVFEGASDVLRTK